MNIIKHNLYTFEDKTSDEVLLINGFSHINQLIPYVNDLQSQLEQKEKQLNELEKEIKHYMSYSTNEGLLEHCMSDLLSIIERNNDESKK